jgi:hypothetical protein
MGSAGQPLRPQAFAFLLNDGQWKSKGAFTVHSSFTVMPGPQQLFAIDRSGDGLPILLLRNNDSVAMVQ